MACARQEGALACSSQEPCEERTITDPAFYLARELRARELTGLPGPTQGPPQFRRPPGFQSPGSRLVLATSRSVQLGQGGLPHEYVGTELGRRCGWGGRHCSQGMESSPVLRIGFPPVYQLWAQGIIQPPCASVSPSGKATGPTSWDYMSSSGESIRHSAWQERVAV